MNIAAILPAYCTRAHILAVLRAIGPEVAAIYVVDDACPQGTGDYVRAQCHDARVRVIRHTENQGVGGAVMSGYRAALADGMDILVKIDSDGQMDPALLMGFVAPIRDGKADYTKGNRFFDLESVRVMPRVRLAGNAALSLLAKLSSGYWNIFDPTNGYTAIHASVARQLPFEKISRGYFFETDMLFRLGTLRAVVADVPMRAVYGSETSHLQIRKIVFEFLFKHARNATKRIFYNYYLRDMSLASLELPAGLTLVLFALVHGALRWSASVASGVPTTAGSVMLAALPALAGLQLLLSFIGHDVAAVPQQPIHPSLTRLAPPCAPALP